jgi:hypothetical protein
MNIERWNRLLASLGAEADPETFEKLQLVGMCDTSGTA